MLLVNLFSNFEFDILVFTVCTIRKAFYSWAGILNDAWIKQRYLFFMLFKALKKSIH